MDITNLIAENRQAVQASAEAAAQAKAKAEKKAALFTTLDGLLGEINQAYLTKNWQLRDRACMKILALTRYHLRQGGKAKFRLRVLWYSCRAYTALGPVQAKQNLERFEEGLLSYLKDIPEMPEWVGTALKGIHARALKADAQDAGVKKTVERSAKPKNGQPHQDRRRPKARNGPGGHRDGPVLVATCGDAGENAMIHALKDIGLVAAESDKSIAA